MTLRKFIRLPQLTALRIAMFFAVVFLVLGFYQEVVHAFRFHFLEQIEYKALDSFFLFRGQIHPQKEDVAIVAIDEKSIEYWGRWPWDRQKHALLLRRLGELGVKAAAYDIVFSEPEESGRLQLIRRMRERVSDATAIDCPPGEGNDCAVAKARGELWSWLSGQERAYDFDRSFADAIGDVSKKGMNVVLGYFFFRSAGELADLDPQVLKLGDKVIESSKFTSIIDADFDTARLLAPVGVRPNLPIFTEQARWQSFFNMIPDRDGVFRRAPMFMRRGEGFYPSLSLGLLAAWTGQTPLLEAGERRVAERYGSSENVRLTVGDYEIPIDDEGNFVIKYYGRQRTFKHYSVADIMEGTVTKADLGGKAVLIGATALAVYDLRNTPVDENFPGVEIHANVFANVQNQDFLRRPNWVKAIELLIYLGLGAVMGLALAHLRLTTGLLVTLFVWVGLNIVAYYVMFLNGYWMKIIVPTLEIYTIFIAVSVFRYVTEEREKGKIRKAFQQYLSPLVVEQVTADPDKLRLGGEKRDMTVVFSDIRGFTTISEKLKPEELVALLNEYLTPMTDLVFRYEGTIDKYMGDAIMAFWGAPLVQENHAELACRTALAMLEELHVLQKQWAERGLPFLDIGIGLNSGMMSVGNMGSSQRFDYTVMGDNVNLGSRLEGINKEYRTNIICSEFTYGKVDGKILCRELDAVRVKGKLEPVHIYEVLGQAVERATFQPLIDAFAIGLKAYRDQRWADAEEQFKHCLELRPNDGPSLVYLDRVAMLRDDPPGENWDGVWVMKTK
jgi:adenylate cyclase